MYERTYPDKRFKITMDFVKKYIDKKDRILDLGVENPLGKLMKDQGFEVVNTTGEDLDDDLTFVENFDGEVVTAFEIMEHMVAPYNVLKVIPSNKLFVSVPLKLWFAGAYRNHDDKRDQHYHEFESWQLDYVLEKAGWKIIDSKKFTHPAKKLGIRPLLRLITPRYYLVYCERPNSNS